MKSHKCFRRKAEAKVSAFFLCVFKSKPEGSNWAVCKNGKYGLFDWNAEAQG